MRQKSISSIRFLPGIVGLGLGLFAVDYFLGGTHFVLKNCSAVLGLVAINTPTIFLLSLILIAFIYRFTRGLGRLLVLGGAISILIQRLLFGGCVFDYINLFGISSVNVSDIVLSVGTLLILHQVLFSSKMVYDVTMSKTVLLIEDEFYLRDLYKELLEDAGFQVTEASDGEIGEKLAKEGNWDILLLDIMLPKLDGLAVLKSIKEAGVSNGKSIVVLSNIDSSDIIQQCISLGVSKYIVKASSTPQSIVDTILGFVDKKKDGLK